MFEKLKLIPAENDWKTYLRVSLDYLQESWPGNYSNYEAYLKKRLVEGSRYLFFLSQGEKKVGIANLYLEDDVLHIAEFGIIPEERKKGFGSQFLKLLCQWTEAKVISAEVDKDMAAFWEKQGWKCESSGERLRFWKEL